MPDRERRIVLSTSPPGCASPLHARLTSQGLNQVGYTLGIQLRRVGTGTRLTFSEGEDVLSEWMRCHATVCWVTTQEPWLLETRLINDLKLPLNLDQNTNSQFRSSLSQLRAQARQRARSMPIVPR